MDVNARQTVAPTTLPVTVDEAKCQLALLHTFDDLYIQGLVGAATDLSEQHTQRAFVTQTWVAKFPCFSDVMRLPRPNLQSVTAVQYYDATDNLTTLSTSAYIADDYALPAAVRRSVTGVWPSTSARDYPVEITYVAGFGDAAAVPMGVKQAIVLMTGHLYLHREATEHKDVVEMPLGYEAFLQPYRVQYV